MESFTTLPQYAAAAPQVLPGAPPSIPAAGRRGRAAVPAGATEPKPDRLLRAVGLMLFAYVWRLQDAFPILSKFYLPILFAGLALVYFATSRHPWRRLSQIRLPVVTLSLVLFALMVLGIPGSLWRGASFSFTFKGFLPNLVFMGLVAASVRTTRDVEWYAKVNLYGAIFYATIVNLFFHVGYDGRLGDLVYYDANDFALIMVCTIPFGVYALKKGNRARSRVFGIIGLWLFALAVVKSGSRGGFLGFVAVILYVLLRYRAIPSRVRLFAGVGGVALLLLLASDKYWTMMSTMLHPKDDYNWSGEQGRREIWKRGVGYAMSHPILGIGVRSYPIAEGTLSEVGRQRLAEGKGFKWSVAHNSFLETAAELGIPAAIVFIAMFAVTIRALTRIRLDGPYGPWVTAREVALAQLLIGSFVGYVVAGFFVSAEYFSYLYFLFGLAAGLLKLVRLRRATTLAMLAQHGRGPGAPGRAPVWQPAASGAR
ncbi:MAG: O-antigen ligase family protein [Gemmatimonadaceae bacterium]|nr:O-antigen ligase family protein [Gemmatimonadaceae bacterium]